jgi:AraC-like DNA-binding protein
MTTEVVLTRWETDRSVHETAVRPARGAARQAVRGNVGYEEWPASRMVRREVARCGVALILAFGEPLEVHDGIEGRVHSLRAFVVGNQSRATLTELSGHQHGVQVELSAAAALALFGRVGGLNNAVVPLDEALGRWGARLVEQLGDAATWADRFTLVDAAFGTLAISDRGGISPEVSWLRRQLLATGGQARVEPLMDETGWSRRLVTDRFRAQLGLPPKAYARILRFQRAVGLLAGVGDGRTLADVAIECGYYDQSHLTRDFVALAGCAPTALIAESTGEPAVRFLQDDGRSAL